MLSFLAKYGQNINSQFLEDGVIEECVKRIGIEKGYCVEVGGNDGMWLSNTRALIDKGWHGTFIEADFRLHQKCKENWKDNKLVRSACSRVSAQNINAFVTNDCDVFSSDTDGIDYEIFKALKARPKICIVEIDSGFPPESEEFNSDGAPGYRPMLRLGIEKGYFLLCHTGNMIFVLNEYRELFPEIKGDGLSNSELYFNPMHLTVAA